MTPTRCSTCFRPRFGPSTAARGPGCTTRSSCATSGPADCYGPRGGHPCTEPTSAEPPMNISTIIDAAAAADPDRAALITDGRTITYGEFADAVERCADRLCACGVSGKRVAVVAAGSR